MTTYNFETITAAQAQAITSADKVIFTGAPARTVSVTYQSYDPLALTPELPRILVTYEGRTVSFATDLVQLSNTGGLVMSDGSRLFIGDTADNQAFGATGHDALYGGPGSDTLTGGSGDDLLHGNSGDDMLRGEAGSNTVYGGLGNDTIVVATGDETRGSFAQGNKGDDEIFGGGGSDTLLGGQGDDFLVGRDGSDYISGDLGADEIHGGSGADTLIGGAGDDQIQTGGGADRVLGGEGDDRIIVSGPGGSIVSGEDGNDTLAGSADGKDIFSGGAGRDVFEFASKNRPAEGQDDVILDWNGADDQLTFAHFSIYSILPREYSEFVATDYAQALTIANSHISGPGATYAVAQVGSDVIVFADTNGDHADGAETAVVLVGKTLADISYSDFI